MVEIERGQWVHRKGDQYIVIVNRVVGNPERGFDIEHYQSGSTLPTIAAAKRTGLIACESDDFNIGAIRGGKLMATLWMESIVDDEPEVVDGIARALGLSDG